MDDRQGLEPSEKSYGVAVSLCMIFGILGIHHFYLENRAHGIFDLGLFIIGFGLLILSGDQPMMVLIGSLLIALDILHTFVITILLLIGKVKDGQGRLVMYPGQR